MSAEDGYSPPCLECGADTGYIDLGGDVGIVRHHDDPGLEDNHDVDCDDRGRCVRPITLDAVWREAADLIGRNATPNPEYERALVEVITRLTPGASHDNDPDRLAELRRLAESGWRT